MTNNFLSQQLDYIFFFYGLSFIILATTIYSIWRKELSRLPWKWLARFGLTHGLYEWLDLLALSLGDSPIYYAIRLAFMAISFIFLLQFGIEFTASDREKEPRSVLLIFLLLLASLGGLFDLYAVNTSIRYSLGLTGGLWAMTALWRYRRREHPQSRSLVVAAGAMAVYALATGFVVPEAAFFPATLINNTWFMTTFGFPIQLLRGLMGCLLAAAIWRHHSVLRVRLLPEEYAVYGSRYFYWPIIGMCLLLLAGWLLTHYIGESGRHHDNAQYNFRVREVMQTLETEMEAADRLVKTMSGSPVLTFMTPDTVKGTAELAAINGVLDRYAMFFKDSVVYFLDTTGLTIASSNRDTPQSFVGHSYAMRPYFQEALEKGRGRFVAIGLTSLVPGAYFSARVSNSSGQTVGIAIIKINLDKMVLRHVDGEFGFLTESHGIIIASSVPDLLLHQMWPVSRETKIRLLESKQFPAILGEPLLTIPQLRAEQVIFQGQSWQIFKKSSQFEGLSLFIFGKMRTMRLARLVGIFITLLFALTLIFFLVLLENTRANAARIAAADRRYRQIFESNQGIQVLFDPQTWAIVDANTAAARFYGYARDELRRKTIMDLSPLPSEKIIAKMQAAVQEMQASVFLHRLANGQTRHVEVYSGPVHIENRTLLYAIIHDVTERQLAEEALYEAHLQLEKRVEERTAELSAANALLHQEIVERLRAEKSLRESEGIFRAIFEQSYHFIGTLSLEGILLKANSTAMNFAGVTEAEIIGKPFWETPWWTHSPLMQAQLRAAIIKASQGQFVQFEATHPDTHGQMYYVDFTIKPVTDQDGRVILLIPEGREITARRQAEMALMEREMMFRTIAENSLDSIVRFDNQGRHIYVNPMAEKQYQSPREKVLGHTFSELGFPAEIVALWEKAIKRVFQNRQPERFEFQLASTMWIDSLLVPEIDHQGVVTAVMASSRDISERRLAEEERKRLEQQLLQAQKMEAIGTLAGGIAHDFNNILQAISGYLQLMLIKTEKDLKMRRYVLEINGMVERASELVRSLLTFSRRTDRVMKPMDLNETIVQALKMVERTIPKMIDIKTRLAPDLRLINGAAAEWEQALMNLTTNARDAMPEGGNIVVETMNITVDKTYGQTYNPLPAGEYVLMLFSDNGIGMDKETVAKIFEPFFTTKAQDKGTGLGLSIVYGIVKGHNGHITCYSENRQGTVFKIYIPALLTETDFLYQPPDRPETIPGGQEVILLVDDETAIIESVQEILADYGYTILQASSGEEALTLVQSQPGLIDLVILDLSMPGMGGRNCMLELLKIAPQLPIIIASGYSLNGQSGGLLEAGARAFLGKPYKFAAMLKQIREVLDQT